MEDVKQRHGKPVVGVEQHVVLVVVCCAVQTWDANIDACMACVAQTASRHAAQKQRHTTTHPNAPVTLSMHATTCTQNMT